jgi:hypothetical protein
MVSVNDIGADAAGYHDDQRNSDHTQIQRPHGQDGNDQADETAWGERP